MAEPLADVAARVFQYSVSALQRRHGPRGYEDYRAYKPWLRDDFSFRCIYCLCRERWEPSGHAVFSVEHVRPQATHPEQVCDYDNLLYACSTCNTLRGTEPLPFDPTVEAMGTHSQILPDSTVRGLTKQGQRLGDLCQLNRPKLVQYRLEMQELVALLVSRPGLQEQRILQSILGYPDDLPNLRSRRPPEGNFRPAGLAASHFERRKRGDLPVTY
jgi:hypothetical protein